MTKDLGDGRIVHEVSIAEIQSGDINIGNVDVLTMPDVDVATLPDVTVTSMPDQTFGGYTYLGEEAIAMDGTSKSATLPEGTNFVEISAAGGNVYYAINDDADASSGGFVPQNQLRYTLKLANLSSLSLYGTAGATAHLLYRQEP